MSSFTSPVAIIDSAQGGGGPLLQSAGTPRSYLSPRQRHYLPCWLPKEAVLNANGLANVKDWWTSLMCGLMLKVERIASFPLGGNSLAKSFEVQKLIGMCDSSR